jgi:multiple sugar transport system permease protein
MNLHIGRGIQGHLFTVLVAVTYAGPVLWILGVAFMDRKDLFSTPTKLWFSPTASNFLIAFIQKDGLIELFRSIWISCTAAAVSLLVCLPFLVSRILRGRTIANDRGTLYALFALPATFVAIPFFIYVTAFGIPSLFGYLLALIGSMMVIGTLIIDGYLQQVKRSALESMQLYGGLDISRASLFVCKDAGSVISVALLFMFLIGWHDLVLVLVLGGDGLRTMNVAIVGLVTPIGTFWGEIAARSSVSVLCAAVIALVANDQMYKGFSLGK